MDGYLLDDVPQIAGAVQPQQPVINGDFVEVCAFLIAQKRVWDPYEVPASFTEAYLC